MNLRDYLLEKGIKQSELAKTVHVDRAYLSRIICGKTKAGVKLAHRIEKATNGEIKARDIVSGKAVGYEGEPKRVMHPDSKLRKQLTPCSKFFSLI
jgi:transcriptional regulator with XRE-family HTH domain